MRYLYSRFSLNPSSKPYLSGDSLMAISNIKIVSESDLNVVRNIKKDDIVFLSTHLLAEFNRLLNGLNKDGFYLITHNSDLNTDYIEQNSQYVKPKIWFAQNYSGNSDYIFPMPIGLENKRLYTNGIPKYFKSNKNNTPIIPKIFYKFTIETNPNSRCSAFQMARKHPLAKSRSSQLIPRDYINELRQYMFCLAPEGNGHDTHRIWECIYINVVPICLESKMTRYYESKGLPIWVINNWNDLNNYSSENELKKKYSSIIDNSNKKIAYLEYYRTILER